MSNPAIWLISGLTLTDFLPMAMESLTLREALIALAAGHLALTNQSYKLLALEARSKALRSLANHVVAPHGDTHQVEAKVAACLTFVIDDIGVATGEDWLTHMKAACHLIRSAEITTSSGKVLKGTEAFRTTAEGRWILRNFAYHDILGSVTSQQPPLLNASYLIDIADVVDSCTGLATELLAMAATVGRIEQELHLSKGSTRQIESRFLSDCAGLEQRLKDWRCRDEAPTELAAVAYAYRSAVLIVLYRAMRNQAHSNRRKDTSDTSHVRSFVFLPETCSNQVAEIVDHISKIPVDSTSESPLLFPLFLAGSEASEPGDIAVIRYRLQKLWERRQFRNISRAITVLESLWHRRRMDEPDLDWACLTSPLGEGLLLT
jgi:transcriptional activator protein UGA3